MTETERAVLITFLGELTNIFDNLTYIDIQIKNTPANRELALAVQQQMEPEDRDILEISRNGEYIYLTDWMLADYLKKVVEALVL